MKTIAEFVNLSVDGWATHSILPGLLIFINAKEGIQLTTDIKDYGKYRVIHASLSPLSTIPDPPSVIELFFRTADILQLFFNDRGFAQRPIDERQPNMRHYFSIIEQKEEEE